MVAGHIVFGEALLPSRVTLCAEGMMGPDELEADAEAIAFGEVYKDVEGARRALSMTREVRCLGLLGPAGPGGVFTHLDQRCVALVVLV